MLKQFFFLIFLIAFRFVSAKPLNVVAAENFYGDVAKSIGGSHITITSILSNPKQDPHLFSSNFSVSKAIANADVIIYNGIDYDPWIIPLIRANIAQTKVILVVADIMGKKVGDNPHLWYDPQTMPTFAEAFTDTLVQLDPSHTDDYKNQLQKFKESQKPLSLLISNIKQAYQGIYLIATEPLFNYMASALDMKMLGNSFQLSVMNDTEPSAKDILNFENALKKRLPKVLIYNGQVSSKEAEKMKQLARENGIPTIGMSETQPPGKSYVEWMINQLDGLEQLLQKD